LKHAKNLLIEGKEPPQYRQIGESIELTIIASSVVPSFRQFITRIIDQGINIDVDHLIVLNYLLRHREITSLEASYICQRSVEQSRELLSHIEKELDLIQSGGIAKGKYYTLKPSTYTILEKDAQYDRDKRLDKESIKIRILTLLKERNLTNEEIRQFTGLTKLQIIRLMHELENDGVKIFNRGRASHYYIESN